MKRGQCLPLSLRYAHLHRVGHVERTVETYPVTSVQSNTTPSMFLSRLEAMS